MQKSSLKKLSILGLVLFGASAVTTAFLPNKERFTDPGVDRLTNSTLLGAINGASCVPDGFDNDCNATFIGLNMSSSSNCGGCAFLSSSAKNPATTNTAASANTTL